MITASDFIGLIQILTAGTGTIGFTAAMAMILSTAMAEMIRFRVKQAMITSMVMMATIN